MNRAEFITVIAIAVIGAIGLALLVGAMTKHKTAPPVVVNNSQTQPMAKVLVAKHDLPVGTRLGPNDMSWQDWPATAVNAAFITDGQGARVAPTGTTAVIADQANQTARAAAAAVTGGSGPMEQLYGSIVREAILANEPVTNAKLVRGGEGGYMAVVLQPGMRAISVQVNAMTAAGGFILPGDRVDVLQSRPADANANPNANARTVPVFLLRNIRVLAIDQNSQAPKNGQQSQVGATATIEVAATDTEVIARAKDVILALRPYSDAGGPAGRASDAQDTGQVRIFRGGQAAEVVTIQ